VDYVVALLVGLGLAELATLITTIYLHRVLSHKSIELHPAMTFFMRIGTWMLTSISPTWRVIRTALASRGIGRSCSPTSTTTGGRQTTSPHPSDGRLPRSRLSRRPTERRVSRFVPLFRAVMRAVLSGALQPVR
jgi:hypothetical protein